MPAELLTPPPPNGRIAREGAVGWMEGEAQGQIAHTALPVLPETVLWVRVRRLSRLSTPPPKNAVLPERVLFGDFQGEGAPAKLLTPLPALFPETVLFVRVRVPSKLPTPPP